MAEYNFTIPQGSDVTLPITLKDEHDAVMNLTGYTVAMQLRRQKNSRTAIDTLTTANGRASVDGTHGKFTLAFPHAVTEGYPATRLVYDIEITSTQNERTRILEGVITVTPEVTRV